MAVQHAGGGRGGKGRRSKAAQKRTAARKARVAQYKAGTRVSKNPI